MDSNTHKLPWTENIKQMLSKFGFMSLFLENNHQHQRPFIFKKLNERQTDIFYQEVFEIIQNNDGKLRTYALIKLERVLKSTSQI